MAYALDNVASSVGKFHLATVMAFQRGQKTLPTLRSLNVGRIAIRPYE